MTQFKSLLDFVVDARENHIFLIHAECKQTVTIAHPPIGLEELVRAAADHECPE